MLKKKKYIYVKKTNEPIYEPQAPEGKFIQCPSCKKTTYIELFGDDNICPKCSGLLRLTAEQRINITVDEGTFVEFDKNMNSMNPIKYPEYESKIKKNQNKTNLKDAVVTGTGLINGYKACIGVMDSNFMMASMGSVVGEKLTRLFEYATINDMPVIVFTCSGGARMQEGIISLMQMAKVSNAVRKHSDKGLLYITVLTDPTTGGVSASFAMQGDIILSEPNALIGFAGRRVIEETLKENLPDNFQKSDFLLECGFVDKIVERQEIKDTLTKILNIHIGDENECV